MGSVRHIVGDLHLRRWPCPTMETSASSTDSAPFSRIRGEEMGAAAWCRREREGAVRCRGEERMAGSGGGEIEERDCKMQIEIRRERSVGRRKICFLIPLLISTFQIAKSMTCDTATHVSRLISSRPNFRLLKAVSCHVSGDCGPGPGADLGPASPATCRPRRAPLILSLSPLLFRPRQRKALQPRAAATASAHARLGTNLAILLSSSPLLPSPLPTALLW